jgi:hypothetical protein
MKISERVRRAAGLSVALLCDALLAAGHAQSFDRSFLFNGRASPVCIATKSEALAKFNVEAMIRQACSPATWERIKRSTTDWVETSNSIIGNSPGKEFKVSTFRSPETGALQIEGFVVRNSGATLISPCLKFLNRETLVNRLGDGLLDPRLSKTDYETMRQILSVEKNEKIELYAYDSIATGLTLTLRSNRLQHVSGYCATN